jgi:hypothetical protein
MEKRPKMHLNKSSETRTLRNRFSFKEQDGVLSRPMVARLGRETVENFSEGVFAPFKHEK